MSQPNPFAPPTTNESQGDRVSPLVLAARSWSTISAPLVWLMATLKLCVVVPLMSGVFAEFGIRLPLFTRILLHPLAALACGYVTVVLVVNHFSGKPLAERRRRASIGFAIGVFTVLAVLVAMLLPFVLLRA